MPTVSRQDIEQLAGRLEAGAESLDDMPSLVVQADMRLAAAVLRAAVARGFPPTPIDTEPPSGGMPEASRASSHSSS